MIKWRQAATFVSVPVFVFLLWGAAPARAHIGDCADMVTDKGKITGTLDKESGVCSYKGVPYAAPPVGPLRFSNPREHEPWASTLIAGKHQNSCLQFPMMSGGKDSTVEGDEDCLYLNVWHRAGAPDAPRPVMVFIHGGGFIYGSGHMDPNEGTKLAEFGDVVVVTINYRLGPFGFLVHPAFRDAEGHIGNYGLYDQTFALKWVNRNIAAFGGDPANVTIFGESAGGMSVGMQIISPVSRGLFHKAIIESAPVVLITKDVARMENIGERAAGKAGCGDPTLAAQCLRAMPAADILRSMRGGILFVNDPETTIPFEPVIGEAFLPDNPLKMFRDGRYPTDMPVILGSNKDEASYFVSGRDIKSAADFDREARADAEKIRNALQTDVFSGDFLSLYDVAAYDTPKKAYSDLVCDVGFTCPTRLLANLLSKNGTPTYMYYFTKTPTPAVKDWGAFHGAELPFVFGNFQFLNMKFPTKGNKALAKKVIQLWTSFARTGTPTASGAPAWPAYESGTQPFLVLDEEITTGTRLKYERCRMFDDLMMKNIAEK